MRTIVPMLFLLAACGAPPEPPPASEPQPQPQASRTTAVTLRIDYDPHDIVKLSVSGDAGPSARHFGPFDVAAHDLPPGESVGLLFNDSDAGEGMVCVSSIDDHGVEQDSNCTTITVRAGEIVAARIDIDH